VTNGGEAGRLADQLAFLVEVDALKSVVRRNHLADGSRRENTAEHSWTLALMAAVLAEHADEPVDVGRVMRMVVIHDIVEVDAGDTYIYDDAGLATKADREAAAAERLFGLLPAGQGTEFRALWEEFEAGASPDARFARALDRFAGFLLNHESGGLTWREHGVTADRVADRMRAVGDGSSALLAEGRRRLDDAVARGLLPAGPPPVPSADGGGPAV
jgi:putative hydrolase of HD superfamily